MTEHAQEVITSITSIEAENALDDGAFRIPATAEEVLKTYNFAVVHLRQQYRFRRLGLTLGAGVSVPLGYPSWEGLVASIAKDPTFSRNILTELPEAGLSASTQRLFEYFHRCVPKDDGESARLYAERVNNLWKRILAKALYNENPTNIKSKKIENHPYLNSMIPIIEKSNVCINFNFDDSIEHALDIINSAEMRRKKGRNYETRWDLSAPIRNDIPTIFHPNGFIPHREHEYASDNVVFDEDSFLKRMTIGKVGDDSVWMNEYINNTYIHVGISLKDEILKSLLQKSWRAAPANVHFQIHYISSVNLNGDIKDAITDANFRVLNLYTLFLGDDGTKALFDLITMEDRDFQDLARRIGCRLKFVYYVTGPVGVGKTTVVNHFRNLWAMDEWLEPSPALISRPYDKLSEEDKREADSWVGHQFHLKNRRIMDANEAVFIVDRCPLDPITFEVNDPKERARSLALQIAPGKSEYAIEEGMVFRLEADPYELRVRLIRKWKFWDENIIRKLSRDIEMVYGNQFEILDTKGLSIEDVVRAVAKAIFLGKYEPMHLHAKLDDIVEKGLQ